MYKLIILMSKMEFYYYGVVFMKDENKKAFPSIINPGIDEIVEKVPNIFYAINMVQKRCNQLPLKYNKQQKIITHARLTTYVLKEIAEGKVSVEV